MFRLSNGTKAAQECSASLFAKRNKLAASEVSEHRLPSPVAGIVTTPLSVAQLVQARESASARDRGDVARPSASTAIFEVEKLDVRLGRKLVLAGCDLTIFPGVTCVMGQSGTGKSTLLKALIGLYGAERGAIRFRGINVTQMSRHQLATVRRDVAFVFQGGALFSSLTVFENCALALRERDRLDEDETRRRVSDALERVGLSGAEQRMPHELSGGMIKRVAIARALAMRPYVMLFDEPTTGADPIMTAVLFSQIHKIVGTLPVACVVVTHDVSAIRRFADRVALLFEGNVIWEGRPSEMERSGNPIVEQFVAGSIEGPIPI